jgi:alpha-D-ribose 1-methylphosphonate 5-triphosphate synthase subunit PhnL
MKACDIILKVRRLGLVGALLLMLPQHPQQNLLAQPITNPAAQQKSVPQQPHMSAALEHLKLAEREIDEAEADQGGHRQRAVQLVRQAIAEVQAGMKYSDLHQPKKK